MGAKDDIAIKIEGLGKRYRLGETVDLQRTFRETLMTVPRHFGRKAARAGKRWAKRLQDRARQAHYQTEPGENEADAETPPGTFWALRDIDLEVKRGEAVGIIGRNGAGKSTLLKILSRITSPTTGQAELRGRVGSLLEIGTGFNPELTGRENIYLNGAILGMRKAEIVRKFDEIVAFADTEKFLDTPVKRYSSGMRLRLGFAVAAHLELEILIVDEVLAVGDAEFQRKCLGKMEDVAGSGRTVLFVSHNMQAIRRLCSRAILLRQGRIVEDGAAEAVVGSYLTSTSNRVLNENIPPEMHKNSTPDLEIFRVELVNGNGEATDRIMMEEPFTLRLHYRIQAPEKSYRVGFVLRAPDLTRIATSVTDYDGDPHFKGGQGRDYVLDVAVINPLMPGVYLFDLIIKNSLNELVDAIQGVQFEVLPGSTEAQERSGAGLVWLDASWKKPYEA